MRLGYNTNGLAHHRWEEAIEIVAEAGYESVAITVDHHCLDPQSPSFSRDLQRMRSLLEQHNLRCVIETGARFLLDPRRKHQPTLLSTEQAERTVRREFLEYCIDIATELRADAVSFWSGSASDGTSSEQLQRRLADECRRLCDYAAPPNVRLAFEPEPGMFLETCDQFEELLREVDHPLFGLTLDVGHVHCLQDGSLPDRVRQFSDVLFNVHIEDMAVGVHDHLAFGAGTIDFPPLMAAFREIGYAGGLHVELSRHSHMGPEMLRTAYAFLSNLLVANE